MKTKKTLKESEARYRTLVDMAPDAILVHQDGIIVYCNIAALRLYDAGNYEQIIGMDHLGMVHPDDRESILARAKSVLDGNITTLHKFRHIRLDGREIPVETMAAPVDWKGRPAIQVIIRDITIRVKAEEDLKKSEERLRLAIEAAHMMVHDHDVRTGRIDALQGLTELLGYEERTEYTLDWWRQLIHPDDIEKFHGALDHTLSCRCDYMVQYRIRHKDNRYLYVEDLARPVCAETRQVIRIIRTIMDITQRKHTEMELQRHREHLKMLVKERTAQLEARNAQLAEEIRERIKAEKALQEMQEEYKIHFHHSNDVMYSYDADFRILSITPNVERMLGYKPEELVGRTWDELDILDPRDLELALAHAMEGLSGKSVHFANYHFISKDGKTMVGEVSGIPLRRDNKVVGVISVARDVTERIRAEEEKKRLESELLQVQKMDALGRFAGGIAHDLNNLLYPIIIDTEMLIDESDGKNGVQEALHHILSAAYRQRDLVKQILSFSRKGDHTFQPVRITPLLHETLALLRSSLPSSIAIRHHVEAASDTILGNPTQIQQIIMNLCRNAADALESQTGTINVNMTNTYLGRLTDHPDRRENRYLLLTVKDTGSGIRPEIRDRIFEPFFTTKEIGKGSGMGLAVAHGIAKSHGGFITVESEPGKGSCFHVYFPVSTEKQKPDTDEAMEFPVHAKGNILLIDDEELILFSLQQALQKSGYRVVAVKDSLEACALFRKEPEAFDLVITDMTMPRLSGAELAKRLMGIRADIPVILCTGYSDIIDEQEAKRIGIREMILKPSNIFDMDSAIRRALGID